MSPAGSTSSGPWRWPCSTSARRPSAGAITSRRRRRSARRCRSSRRWRISTASRPQPRIWRPLSLLTGQHERAARFFALSQRLLRESGSAASPVEQERVDKLVADTRAALDEERFTAAWAEGNRMTIEQMVTDAAAMTVGVPAPEKAWSTRRQSATGAGRPLRHLAARARGTGAAGGRPLRSRDRQRALHQPPHRHAPRLLHPRQARRPHPHRRRHRRPPARAGVTRVRSPGSSASRLLQSVKENAPVCPHR